MQQGGEALIDLLHGNAALGSEALKQALQTHAKLPHVSLFQASLIEPADSMRDTCAGHLEEAVMHEVPTLDRSLWVLRVQRPSKMRSSPTMRDALTTVLPPWIVWDQVTRATGYSPSTRPRACL